MSNLQVVAVSPAEFTGDCEAAADVGEAEVKYDDVDGNIWLLLCHLKCAPASRCSVVVVHLPASGGSTVGFSWDSPAVWLFIFF